jgi:RHS repeat-associated protein
MKINKFLLITPLLVFLSVIAIAAPVYANIPTQGEDAVCWDGSSDGSGQATTGKPVNLYTGSETLTRTDLSIGNLYPITIQRRYNSTSVYDSPLGYGWALNYDKRLYIYPDGSATVRKDCGQKLRFTWSVLGFSAPVGDYGTLEQNADGTYTYTSKDGTKENYDIYGRLATIVNTKGNSLVLTYIADYRTPLTGILLANLDLSTPGIVSYDYRLNKIEEKDGTGSLTNVSVTFSYDTSTGRLNGLWDNTGYRSVTYNHDTSGNLTGVTGPSANAVYTYNSTGNLHSLTNIDEGSGEYINTYDSKGRVTQQKHANGIIDIEYLADRKVKITTTVNDANSNALNTGSRTVEFDNMGMVVKNTDALGNVTNYIRDAQTSKIIREEYWENTGTIDTPNLVLKAGTDYTFDSYGNMKTKTEASNPNSTDWDAIKKTTWYYYVYELDSSATSATKNSIANEIAASAVDPSQYRYTKYNYDNANGNLLTLVEMGLLGDGSSYTYTTTYDYYPNGQLKSVDGPRTDAEDKTTFTYDSVTGYRTSMTQPIIGTTTYSDFDGLGNPRTVIDPNSNSTYYTYDSTGRITSVKAPGDTASTQYFYVSSGCSSCGGANKIDYILLPEGNKIDYDYDAYGNLVTIKDNAGNTINYTYDSTGNKLTEDIRDSGGALQKTLGYQYDALNRLKRINNPDSSYTEYVYDSFGNRTSSRNPNTAITTYSFDALSRLTSAIQPGSVTTTYAYNSNNNLTLVKDARNNTTTYKYDDKERIYQVISPDTGTTEYTYDPAGNMISKKDGKGVTISYSYDAANRLIQATSPSRDGLSAYSVTYTYGSDANHCLNGIGRLCSMDDASGTTTYEYTQKGQVAKESKVIGSVSYLTEYAYDMNGNMKAITYPSGMKITYEPDSTKDRVAAVKKTVSTTETFIAQAIGYYPFSGMSSITYSNGLIGSIQYDNQYRINSITVGNNGSVMNNAYGIDNNGNILSITPGRSYTYDNLDRLLTASGSWGSLTWSYDGVGNRLSENGSNYDYPTNSNRLTAANGISFTYDNNGNSLSGPPSRQYIYNQNQRLIQVDDGSTLVDYVYNGNGQRVKKTIGSDTTIFHYNTAGQIIAESNSNGTITIEYVYLNGQPLAKIEGGNTYYYHNDHLGTPQKMTDSTGAVVWAADYKPFGEVNITTNTVTNNLRFPGQYYDAETGLYQNWHRDYNPVSGTYIEVDPLMFPFLYYGRRYFVQPYFTRDPGKLLPYVYVGNNPVNSVDPNGLQQSSGTGTCPVDPCQKQADDAYNKCMAGMKNGPSNMGTVTCIGTAVSFGFTVSLANKVAGAVVAGGGTLLCLFSVPPDSKSFLGAGECKQVSNEIYKTCKGSGGP